MDWDGAPPNLFFPQKDVQQNTLHQVNIFGMPFEEHADIIKQLNQLSDERARPIATAAGEKLHTANVFLRWNEGHG